MGLEWPQTLDEYEAVLRAFKTQDPNGNFLVVQQDSALLHRSICENLLYGRPVASIEQIYKAAKQAEANEFIGDLQDNFGNSGYDVQVGERRVKLSGGQRQHIALALWFLKEAPILILNEATSALDSEVQAKILEPCSV